MLTTAAEPFVDVEICKSAVDFAKSCFSPDIGFTFSRISIDSNIFSDFFGLSILKQFSDIDSWEKKPLAIELLNRKVKTFLHELQGCHWQEISTDKTQLQCLCFTTQITEYLEQGNGDLLTALVKKLAFEMDVFEVLDTKRVAHGAPGSGNFAMFYAIILSFASSKGCEQASNKFDHWIEYHLNHQNKFGFWGDYEFNFNMFQNGYHQHEILNYARICPINVVKGLSHLLGCNDSRGHFAPWGGGGGCYDFDAVTIFYFYSHEISRDVFAQLLQEQGPVAKLVNSLKAEQSIGGGFSENLKAFKPSVFIWFFAELIEIIFRMSGPLKLDRCKYVASMFLRPKWKKLRRHWSCEALDWDEPNLWDTWLRLMTLDRLSRLSSGAGDTDSSYYHFVGLGAKRDHV